jgi:hypothetical protein
MAWPTKKKPNGLPNMPTMPEYSDKNLNANVALPGANPPGYTDRLASPATLASPKTPNLPSAPEQSPSLSPRAQKFRKLAGLLGPKRTS